MRSAVALLVLGSLLIAAPASLAPHAAADELVLNNGRVLKGKILREDKKSVVLRSARGKFSVPRSMIARVVSSTSPGATLVARRKALDPSDADGLAELAEWAAANGLGRPARRSAEPRADPAASEGRDRGHGARLRAGLPLGSSLGRRSLDPDRGLGRSAPSRRQGRRAPERCRELQRSALGRGGAPAQGGGLSPSPPLQGPQGHRHRSRDHQDLAALAEAGPGQERRRPRRGASARGGSESGPEGLRSVS